MNREREVQEATNAPRVAAAPWIRPATVLSLAVPVALLVIAAYVQWCTVGLPPVPGIHEVTPATATQPYGFPAWIGITHYVNLLFLVLLVRSGLQILMDHPRLYWNVHCTPGTEWVRFTPVQVPLDRLYTAKDDARYLTPWVGLPGGRHTLGLARHWHFVSALFWVLNGAIYVSLLFATNHWRRIVPTSWHIFPDAWAVFVHYATFHLPPEPNGFFQYNPLQQLGYFAVIFILAPLSILTGPAMSPALVNRFSWYRHLPGNRQVGRSIHFLVLCGYVAFVIVHVTMVFVTGFARNMNHIVIGTDDLLRFGMYVGLSGLAILFLLNVIANWASWLFPRAIQRVGDALVNPVLRLLLARHAPRAEYTVQDISSFLWPNGKLPTSDEWKALAANQFKDYRLKVYGLVEHAVELSLEELHTMAGRNQVTLHHCIQGWSGIAQWGGVPMVELMRVVRPKPTVTTVIFYSFGEGLEGGQYYDSHTIGNVRHPQTLLAYEMNFKPLNDVHGAPLRLRVENQLGFKMVKWIKAIEFAADFKHVYKGEGGYNSDHEFFDTMADI
ncbi:MAG TPA: molybdopterin-dependent oxidoreductase [Thermoanaerobaculia bacterium]|nr:molybdopterin-dependent oxidoreductase [Thermoanaerobaculia bacterium]